MARPPLTEWFRRTLTNNAQIASQQDLISGETVSYAYDSLKRLASASSNQGWGQAFTYDGFGNLTAKTATAGSPPVGSYPTDSTTNRLNGYSYDYNGNQLYGGNSMGLSYDMSNRLTMSAGMSTQATFEYDPSNKRVNQVRQHFNGSSWITDATEYYFYGVGGSKLGTYQATITGTVSWALVSTQVFFKGKLIQKGGLSSQEDIRASIGSYFPYGRTRDPRIRQTIR